MRIYGRLAWWVPLAFCLHLSTSALASPENDTLVVAFQREVVDLDYLYTTSQEHVIISDLTDDRLFEIDTKTNDVVPMLATGYQYVNDLTIDVALREGVHFHSGKPFTADDVVYTYAWVLNPASGSRAAGSIRNWLKSVEKKGPYQVRFHLKTVAPLALRDMARRVPIRPHDAYLVDGKIVKGAQALKPDGLGPYRVVSFEPGQRVRLERFEGYYADSPKGRPAIKTIVARTIPDWGTQQAELMRGGVDWAFDMPFDVAQSMAATGRAAIASGPSLRVSFVVLDAQAKDGNPLADVQVRRALNYAVNTDEISKYLIGGASRPMRSACHPNQFACTEAVTQYPFNRQKARDALQQSGYSGSPPIELWAYRDRAVAETVVANLKDAGFNVKLRYAQLAALDKARAAGKIRAYIGSWANGGTADTAMIARIHFTSTDRNLSGNPQVSKLVLDAERTNDPQKRTALYKKALEIIADEAYWIPLFSYSVNYLMSPRLDFPIPEDGLPRLYEARWK